MNTKSLNRIWVAGLAAVQWAATHGMAEVQLETLRSADGVAPMGTVGGLSSDGSTVVGSRWSAGDYTPEVFQWMAGSNLFEITPGSAASRNPSAYYSAGYGVSDDGRVIVGACHETQPGAFCLVNGVVVTLNATRGSKALGMSRDGTVAVGRNPTDIKATSVQAVSWTIPGGAQTVLPDLAGGATMAAAESISADKSTIVGWGTDVSGRKACRWIGGSVTALGDLPGGRVFAEATAVSADGGVIAGRSWSSNGIEAFRWTDATGMESLGDFPGGCLQSEATGVSEDGQVIVGRAYSDRGAEIFVWSETNGMASLQTLMQVAGEDVSGWRFDDTRPLLSADGSVISGNAVDPQQNSVLFRVTGINELTNCLMTTAIAGGLNPTGMILRFPTEPGLTYQAEVSETLMGDAWMPSGQSVVGTGSPREIHLPTDSNASRQLYRLSISH